VESASSGDPVEPVIAAVVSARRLANDSIFEVASRFGRPDEHRYQFVCECGRRDCRELVLLTLAEYRQLASGSVSAHV